MAIHRRKLLLHIGSVCIGLLLGYGLAIGLGGLIPVNRKATPASEGITIYVATNGLHAGYVLPVRAGRTDWRDVFSPEEYAGVDTGFHFLLIGWGERRFYLETPEWKDLRWSTALRALFWPTPGALHVDYLRRPPPAGARCRSLVLSSDQYEALATYILAALEYTPDGRPRLIAGKGYATTDNFYEAKGRYHLFYTCNDWTNRGLQRAGVRTALWSPLDWGVMRWR